MADYKERVSGINGVSKVLVNPHYYGEGTVRLVITSANGVPSDDLVARVQNEVDPVSGEGLGIAPIGHRVTVSGVTAKPVDIALSLAYQQNYDFDKLKEKINGAIDGYFKELTDIWPDQGPVIVRVTGIEKRLLDTEGILDVTFTSLNGERKNLELSENEIPVRGEVSEAE